MNKKNQNISGFTLIELAIVGLFLGLLAIFAISSFNAGATNSTKIKGLNEVVSKVASNWGLIVQYCNISADISTTAISTVALGNTSRKNLAYLLGSTNSLNNLYYSCISQSGIKQLTGSSIGEAGAEKVQEYFIGNVSTLNIGGRNYLALTYSNVPEQIVLNGYNQFSTVSGAGSATFLPTSDSTDSNFRFSTITAGTRSMTIIRPI